MRFIKYIGYKQKATLEEVFVLPSSRSMVYFNCIYFIFTFVFHATLYSNTAV